MQVRQTYVKLMALDILILFLIILYTKIFLCNFASKHSEVKVLLLVRVIIADLRATTAITISASMNLLMELLRFIFQSLSFVVNSKVSHVS